MVGSVGYAHAVMTCGHDFVGNVGNRKQIAHIAHKHAGGGVGAVGHVGNVVMPTQVGGARLYARHTVLCA